MPITAAFPDLVDEPLVARRPGLVADLAAGLLLLGLEVLLELLAATRVALQLRLRLLVLHQEDVEARLLTRVLEGLLLLILMWALALKWNWLKRPGLLTGLFFIGYGAARAFVENFREADAQYITEANPMGHVIRLTAETGLTMGQTLSLPMIAIGLGFWAIALRRA